VVVRGMGAGELGRSLQKGYKVLVTRWIRFDNLMCNKVTLVDNSEMVQLKYARSVGN